WSSTPVLHFRDLGIFGEQVLLSIRFGAWTTVIESESAANWARYWRPEIQGYIHAYRAVTGVDLTESVETTQPAVHLRRRLAAEAAGGCGGAVRAPRRGRRRARAGGGTGGAARAARRAGGGGRRRAEAAGAQGGAGGGAGGGAERARGRRGGRDGSTARTPSA